MLIIERDGCTVLEDVWKDVWAVIEKNNPILVNEWYGCCVC